MALGFASCGRRVVPWAVPAHTRGKKVGGTGGTKIFFNSGFFSLLKDEERKNPGAQKKVSRGDGGNAQNEDRKNANTVPKEPTMTKLSPEVIALIEEITDLLNEGYLDLAELRELHAAITGADKGPA